MVPPAKRKPDAEKSPSEIEVPEGVVPGKTPGWPIDADGEPLDLTPEERSALAQTALDEEPPLPISADDAIGPDARHRVPWAGLLADQPNLRDELHTAEEWQQLLDDYNASERI